MLDLVGDWLRLMRWIDVTSVLGREHARVVDVSDALLHQSYLILLRSVDDSLH